MTLLDTSRWVDYLAKNNSVTDNLFTKKMVLIHPFVIGELAMGDLKDRKARLYDLHRLIEAVVATDEEVLLFIEKHKLFGLSIGYVDVHLLTSVTLMPGTQLWTRDKRLNQAAETLGCAFVP